MFSSRISQNILGSYASPSLNSPQALPHLCTLPTACAFALLGTTTTTTEWEHCVLADCSRAQTQLTTECDWYTQCRHLDKNRFSFSQQPSIVDSFLASVWLHAHFPSTVLKSCLVWVCAVLVHAHAHGHSLFRHCASRVRGPHCCWKPLFPGNHPPPLPLAIFLPIFYRDHTPPLKLQAFEDHISPCG